MASPTPPLTPSTSSGTSVSSVTNSPILMVAPSTYSATACCLAAERALKHLEAKLPEIDKLLLSFRIHDYRIFAGFDERLVEAEIGFLEQIHLILSSEPAEIYPLLSQLAILFSPFSAIVFTKTSRHRIPLSNDEVTQHYPFIDNRNRKSGTYPTAISLSQSQGTMETSSAFRPSEVSNGQSSGGVNTDPSRLSEKDKEQEEGDGDGDGDGQRREHRDRDGDRDGDGDGDGDGDFGDENDRAADREDRAADGDGDGDGDRDSDQGPEWKTEIHFSVTSKLVSSSEMTSDPSPFQSLQTKGTLTIMRTAERPLISDGYGFATCRVQFNELVAKNRVISEKPAYGHFHTTIIIDSLQENATIDHINPPSTRQYQKDVKIASSSKRSWTFSASAVVSAILIKPQLSFTGNAGRTSESGSNIERVVNFDRITEIDMDGLVSWGFYIADGHDQETGGATHVDQLPSARFEFVGDNDTPAPPPKLIDVEVSTYYSVLPRSAKGIPKNIWESPKEISYSNFCQVTPLRIPSNLQGRHNYRAELLVYPRPVHKAVSTVTVDTQVKRDTKSVEVNPLVVDSKRDFGGNRIDDLLKDSTLELTAFRRVRRPVNKLPNQANTGAQVVEFAGTKNDKDSTLKHVPRPARAWIRR